MNLVFLSLHPYTKVVFRQGSRLMASDLEKVAVDTARSVVVLSDTTLTPDKVRRCRLTLG